MKKIIIILVSLLFTVAYSQENNSNYTLRLEPYYELPVAVSYTLNDISYPQQEVNEPYTKFWVDSTAIYSNIERKSLERECVANFIVGRKTGRMDVKNEMMFLDKGYDDYTVKELEKRDRELRNEIVGMKAEYRKLRKKYISFIGDTSH